MARRLESYDFRSQLGRKPTYPWHLWTDGEVWRLTQGKDYTCTSGSLLVYLYSRARRLGKSVRASLIRGHDKRPDRIVLQFMELKDDQPATKQFKQLKRKKA